MQIIWLMNIATYIWKKTHKNKNDIYKCPRFSDYCGQDREDYKFEECMGEVKLMKSS
jgi:hypothetical protein